MYESNVISDPHKIANEINNLFVKLVPSLASRIPCNNIIIIIMNNNNNNVII